MAVLMYKAKNKSQDTVLEIKGLKIVAEHSGDPILNDISLELKRGEVLGLIGESGAGKSTIGLASMGYAREGCSLAAGSIRLNGEELFGAEPKLLRKIRGVKIAYVAQSAAASFNPAFTLDEQVCEVALVQGLMTKDEALAKARKLYASLCLPDPDNIGKRYPHQVSGGQLQRAMTAMAMICEPDLIVFDEPTTALDVTTQVEVLDSIKTAIRHCNSAALYVTHDLAVVAQVADRIMVLRRGALVEMGTTNDILNHPTQEYTRALVNVHRDIDHSKLQKKKEIVLQGRNIDAFYGELQVLYDVSFELHKGETLSIVGESGSGKSTLARVLVGLLPPKNGSIQLDGKPLHGSLAQRRPDVLKRLQIIHQMPDVALNPRSTVAEIIGRPLTKFLGIKGAGLKARIADLLKLVDLPESYASRYPTQLSGGQKQRLCIARALAAEPEVIICDEVTSALDPLVADDILDLLMDIQKKTGVSYIFVTHDISVVRSISDSVMVMHNGKVVESGSTLEVFTPPHAEYTQLLLRSVPEMRIGWLDELLQERNQSSVIDRKGVM